MANTAVTIVVDEQNRRWLSRTVRSARAQARAVLRARIVLAAAAGLPNARIAADLQVGVDAVRKWRSRFAAGGLSGLTDAKRSGRPRRRLAGRADPG
ncbi:helix-turn-helix domain-containing protein [Winogradskya humida]|uniref:helix-turn-helix domain-containing protein n=1 Tax=Winogradskya humida TaxID=113566 RepID=UPI0031CEB7E6